MNLTIATSQVRAGECPSQAHSRGFSNSRQTYDPIAPNLRPICTCPNIEPKQRRLKVRYDFHWPSSLHKKSEVVLTLRSGEGKLERENSTQKEKRSCRRPNEPLQRNSS